MRSLREEKTLNEIAAGHDVHPNQLSRWKAEFLSNAGRVFSKGTDEVEKVNNNIEQGLMAAGLYKQTGDKRMYRSGRQGSSMNEQKQPALDIRKQCSLVFTIYKFQERRT